MGGIASARAVDSKISFGTWPGLVCSVTLIALGLHFIIGPVGGVGRESCSSGTSAGLVSDFAVPEDVPATRPIEEVRVGDRVLAGNPEQSIEQEDPAVDPGSWQSISLIMKKEGIDIDITLLRPSSWIEAKGVAEGVVIELEMAELDAVGPARVLSLAPCPPIEPGGGSVVTGTFSHDSSCIVELSLEGLPEAIGVTARHPIYSEGV